MYPYEQALADSAKEKLPFKRKKLLVKSGLGTVTSWDEGKKTGERHTVAEI